MSEKMSKEEFLSHTETWSIEMQIVFLLENQDWCDLLFSVITEKWETVADGMDFESIRYFAVSQGLSQPRSES